MLGTLASAQVLHVSPDGADTAGCGPVDTPCKSIGFAVNSTSVDGTIILLSPGVFNTSADRNIQFTSNTPSLSIMGSGMSSTRIDALGMNRCFIFNETNKAISISHLTMTRCAAGVGAEWQPDVGSSTVSTGASLWISACKQNVSITSVRIENGVSQGQGINGQGAGAWIVSSNTIFTDSVLDSNRASCGPGGGVLVNGASQTSWFNVTFSSNVADCPGSWFAASASNFDPTLSTALFFPSTGAVPSIQMVNRSIDS